MASPCPPRYTHHFPRSTLLSLPFSIIQRRRATLRRTLHNTSTVSESRAKEDVGVGEEALLERDDDELRTAETRAEERSDVLRVR